MFYTANLNRQLSHCGSSMLNLISRAKALILPTTKFTIRTASAISTSPSPFTSAALTLKDGVGHYWV